MTTIREDIQEFAKDNNLTYEEAIDILEEYYQEEQKKLHEVYKGLIADTH